MIKKFFKCLLTYCLIWLWLFNFSYADLWNDVASNWIVVNKNWQLINIDWWVKFQVSWQWTLLSQYLGVSRRMLSLAVWNPKVYFFFDNINNWIPYAYYQYTSDRVFFQWHFTSYEVCNELQSWDTVLGWCNSYTVNSDTFQEALTPFFNSITSNDYRWYNYWYYTIYNRTYFIRVCFSSQTFWQSVCFRSDAWLNNSLNLSWSTDWSSSLDFWDIPWNLLWNPPWWINGWWWWNIDWSSQNVINSSITWNVTYSTCTNSKALSYYKIQWYNDKLCYSSYWNNTDIYSSPWSVSDYSLTWLDISEVWIDTAWYRRYWSTWLALPYNDWFQYWRKSFEVYNNSYNSSWTVSNPFVWVPVSLFTLFGNVYSYWLAYNNQSIIEYCDLLLFSNLNNPYEWILWDLPCNYSAIDILADTIWVHADSWEVVKWSSWEWILNRPWYHLDLWRNTWSVSSWNFSWLSYFWDWKTFINNSFNLLSDSFRFPDRDSRWIIPSYILVFMFALILFRFISH